jgi:CheY-like chemotaxis protein
MPDSAQGLRVLVVEDETFIAFLLEEMLENLGCVVAGSAANFDQAMRMADEVTADAAIVDVNIGGKQVFPIAERLAARGVRVVFSTGYGSGGLPQAWRMHPVVAKPFDAEELKSALTRALA